MLPRGRGASSSGHFSYITLAMAYLCAHLQCSQDSATYSHPRIFHVSQPSLCTHLQCSATRPTHLPPLSTLAMRSPDTSSALSHPRIFHVSQPSLCTHPQCSATRPTHLPPLSTLAMRSPPVLSHPRIFHFVRLWIARESHHCRASGRGAACTVRAVIYNETRKDGLQDGIVRR